MTQLQNKNNFDVTCALLKKKEEKGITGQLEAVSNR